MMNRDSTAIEAIGRPVADAPARRASTPVAARRDPGERLLARLLELAGPGADLVSVHSRPWASATFTGLQYRIMLEMPEEQAEGLAGALGEAEFRIPGHLVADAVVDESRPCTVSDAGADTGRRQMDLTLLVLEEWR